MSDDGRGAVALRLGALAILTTAAVLRLVGLAVEPLSAPEAGRAAFAWTLAEGTAGRDLEPLRPTEPSPLLESVHYWTATLGLLAFDAGGDLAVRLPGALAGVALVALLLLRLSWVAPVPRLALGALIAVDPTLVAMSRRQGEVALGLLAAALVVLPLARRGQVAGPAAVSDGDGLSHRWALALGCLLASGWVGWAMIPAMTLMPLALRRCPDEAGTARGLRSVDRGFVALGLALASTAAFAAWPLLPELSAGLTSFLGHLGGGCPEVVERASVLTLVAADPLAFGLGPVALVALVARGGGGGRARAALLLAALAGGILVVVTRAAPEALGLAALPMLWAIAALLERTAAREVTSREATARGAGSRVTARALLGAALLVGGIGSLRQLDARAAAPWSPILAPATDPEVRLLVADLREQRAPDGRRLGHRVALELAPDPVLEWYLRAFDTVRVEGPGGAAALGPVSAVLTRAGDRPAEWIVPPSRGASAVGREYRIGGIGGIRGIGGGTAEPVVLWRFVGGDRDD